MDKVGPEPSFSHEMAKVQGFKIKKVLVELERAEKKGGKMVDVQRGLKMAYIAKTTQGFRNAVNCP